MSHRRAFPVQVLSRCGVERVTPVHARFTVDGDAVRMSNEHAPGNTGRFLRRRVALALALATGGASPIAAANADPRLQPALHARVALLADHAAVRPGQRLMAGLRIVHDAGWHSYWINAGDSGLATRFDWTLPEGARAGAIRWPFPERLPAGPLTNFGYGDALLLPAELQVPADAAVGRSFRIALRARWLICAETCIPDEATLALELPIEVAPRASADAADFDATLARVPVPLRDARGHAWRDATHVAVQIDGADWANDAARIEVFPLTPQVVTSTRIEARLGPDGALRFRHPASEAFDRMPGRVEWAIGLHGRDGSFRTLQLAVPGDDARVPSP
jgi:thiol:disulfide interchange protein DsbD